MKHTFSYEVPDMPISSRESLQVDAIGTIRHGPLTITLDDDKGRTFQGTLDINTGIWSDVHRVDAPPGGVATTRRRPA